MAPLHSPRAASVAALFVSVVLSGCTKTAEPMIQGQPASSFNTSTSKAASCLIENIGGDVCTGCSLEDRDNAVYCLANQPEGQIVGNFQICADNQGNARSDVPCDYMAVLIAQGADGTTARQGIPFGVDRVMRGSISGTYLVVAANRENDNPKSFDAVFEVAFSPKKTSIRPIIYYPETRGIFGAYDQMRHRWLTIPLRNDQRMKDLTVDILNEQGKRMGSYAFGADLRKLPGVTDDMWLAGSTLMEQGGLNIGFWKEGVTENKGGPYVWFLILPNEKKVSAAGTH